MDSAFLFVCFVFRRVCVCVCLGVVYAYMCVAINKEKGTMNFRRSGGVGGKGVMKVM